MSQKICDIRDLCLNDGNYESDQSAVLINRIARSKSKMTEKCAKFEDEFDQNFSKIDQY